MTCWGQKYVEVAFGGDSKARITSLVDALETSMAKDIQALPWMTEETKKAALGKLKAITNNVGYPQKWRQYRPVTLVRDDYCGNTFRMSEVARQEQIERIGKTTDKSEWSMTTPTVNAFYSPPLNSINFPAGILQLPFFDAKRDMAVNFGAIGAVIGHEMTHGFDDSGRKYDGAGNLHDWWTAKDGAEFEKRAACIADEYSKFSPVEGVTLNGRLTLGENTAGQRRTAHRLPGDGRRVPGEVRESGRLHPGAARIPGLCAGVLREHVSAGSAHPRDDGPALARTLPGDRHRAEHAGVSESVLVQGGPADGERQRVQGLVATG